MSNLIQNLFLVAFVSQFRSTTKNTSNHFAARYAISAGCKEVFGSRTGGRHESVVTSGFAAHARNVRARSDGRSRPDASAHSAAAQCCDFATDTPFSPCFGSRMQQNEGETPLGESLSSRRVLPGFPRSHRRDTCKMFHLPSPIFSRTSDQHATDPQFHAASHPATLPHTSARCLKFAVRRTADRPQSLSRLPAKRLAGRDPPAAASSAADWWRTCTASVVWFLALNFFTPWRFVIM